MKSSAVTSVFGYVLVSAASATIAIYAWERGSGDQKHSIIVEAEPNERLDTIDARVERIEQLLATFQAQQPLDGSSPDETLRPSSVIVGTNPPPVVMSEEQRTKSIAIIAERRELRVNRLESQIDQALLDFDRAQVAYDEGKIPLSELQELKRRLEELEFNLELTKKDHAKQLLDLER